MREIGPREQNGVLRRDQILKDKGILRKELRPQNASRQENQDLESWGASKRMRGTSEITKT